MVRKLQEHAHHISFVGEGEKDITSRNKECSFNIIVSFGPRSRDLFW